MIEVGRNPHIEVLPCAPTIGPFVFFSYTILPIASGGSVIPIRSGGHMRSNRMPCATDLPNNRLSENIRARSPCDPQSLQHLQIGPNLPSRDRTKSITRSGPGGSGAPDRANERHKSRVVTVKALVIKRSSSSAKVDCLRAHIKPGVERMNARTSLSIPMLGGFSCRPKDRAACGRCHRANSGRRCAFASWQPSNQGLTGDVGSDLRWSVGQFILESQGMVSIEWSDLLCRPIFAYARRRASHRRKRARLRVRSPGFMAR